MSIFKSFILLFPLCFSVSSAQTMKVWENNTLESYSLPQDIDSLIFSSSNDTQYIQLWKNNSSFTQYNLAILDSITFQQGSIVTNPDSGSITDIDGNLYETVDINGQIWLKQNLRTTTYNDGTPIPKGSTDGNIWVDIGNTATYNWYDHDSTTHAASRGALYNWWAVGTGKLCPTGWRVASKTDFDQLVQFLGGTEVAGGKMKEQGSLHWSNNNIGATNESGFTGIPGGYRSPLRYTGELAHLTGGFASLPYDLQFWTSTEASNPDNAWKVYLADVVTTVQIEDYVTKKTAFSARCIKN